MGRAQDLPEELEGEGRGGSPWSLLIVGAGRVGLSLAADLSGLFERGRITVVGRPERPAFLDTFPAVRFAAREEMRVVQADVCAPGTRLALILCVPDREVASAAEEWAARCPAGVAPEVAVHTSGALPSTMLAPLRERFGCALGSWHPLAAMARPAAGSLVGATVGIEGDPAALRFCEWLAARVGARSIQVPLDEKARYHAAAVLASNALVACLSAATEELRVAVGEDLSADVLLALARSALDNVERLGLPAGITGPIARGDAETVRAHLSALDPRRRALYRALGLQLLAVLEPRLALEQAGRVREALNTNPD